MTGEADGQPDPGQLADAVSDIVGDAISRLRALYEVAEAAAVSVVGAHEDASRWICQFGGSENVADLHDADEHMDRALRHLRDADRALGAFQRELEGR